MVPPTALPFFGTGFSPDALGVDTAVSGEAVILVPAAGQFWGVIAILVIWDTVVAQDFFVVSQNLHAGVAPGTALCSAAVQSAALFVSLHLEAKIPLSTAGRVQSVAAVLAEISVVGGADRYKSPVVAN